jgi:hypothetical protein
MYNHILIRYGELSLKKSNRNQFIKQITNHIKTAQIDITIPTLPPTITSPMGPCSGSLIISNTAGAKIVIS